jgi:hypothetical protein
VIFPRFRSSDSGDKFQLNVERLDYATMGQTWERFRWSDQRSQYCTYMWMVPPIKKKQATSMSIVQEALRQRKGESLATVGGPKENENILRGGINNANNSRGMQQYKEMRDQVVIHKEYVQISWAKWVLKVFDPGIGYRGSFLAARP